MKLEQIDAFQVHKLDQSLLEALKKSFDDVKNVKEACDVLDTFFSVSERTRIRDLYNLCKEKILQQLVESTIRQKNSIHRRLRYLNKFYSNMTVELLRFKGLMVKERTLREDVLGSRFFQARAKLITRGQWPYRPATIRAMGLKHMVLKNMNFLQDMHKK